MNLRVKLWTLETRLQFVNFGDAEIQIKCYAKSNEKKGCKTFILPPNSRTKKTVKQVIPSHIKDPSILPDDELVFIFSNKSNIKGQFDVFEQGPYKFPPEFSNIDTPQKLLDAYSHIIDVSDFYWMEKLTVDNVPDFCKTNPQAYSIMNFYFGDMATRIYKYERAEYYFEEAWKYCMPNDRWMYCYNSAKCLSGILTYTPATVELKGRIIQKTITAIERLPENVKGSPIAHLHKISVACLKAFLYCYLDETDLALELFEDLEFKPIREEDYKTDGIENFLTFIDYGFNVAIELKNAALMKRLCMLFEKEKDEIKNELNPMKCFHKALHNITEAGHENTLKAMERTTIEYEKYSPEFPNLREYYKLNEEKNEEAIFKFIPFVE